MNVKEIVSKILYSADAPHSIGIGADKVTVYANQTDVVHLTLDVIDKDGYIVPEANNRLNISIDGPAKLIGVENGDILDLEPHKVPTRKAFMGKALALIQTTEHAGTITVTVSGEGLVTQQIIIESRAK